MIDTFVGLIASGIVMAVCIILVLHREYEDGLIGRAGLALIGLAAAARFIGAMDAIADKQYIQISTVGMTLWIGLALFLARHAWRFFHFKGTEGRRRVRK